MSEGFSSASACCSSRLVSATSGLRPVILLLSVLVPHSYKSVSAFNPEVPSGEPPAILVSEQGYDTSAASADRGGGEMRFSAGGVVVVVVGGGRARGEGGEEKCFGYTHAFGTEK